MPLANEGDGKFDILNRCLARELGADVNWARIDGVTPLFIAAEMAQLGVVRCLVEELIKFRACHHFRMTQKDPALS